MSAHLILWIAVVFDIRLAVRRIQVDGLPVMIGELGGVASAQGLIEAMGVVLDASGFD